MCNEERGKRHLILLISSSQNSSRFIQETFSIFFFFLFFDVRAGRRDRKQGRAIAIRSSIFISDDR